MKARVMVIGPVVAATLGMAPAMAQPLQPTAPPQTASAEVMQCAQARMVVDGLLAAADTRVEAARQANSPAEMRAAVEAVQNTLRDVRAQLAPCASLEPPVDPHSGHAMPAATATPTTPPPVPVAKPPAAADPHAGHTAAPTSRPVAQAGEAQTIEEWLKGYDVAFNAKDLDTLATFYHPDVTIYEGAGVNNGWIDYRDRHLGPELKAFENLRFGHTSRRVHMLGDRAALAIAEYSIKAKMKERMLDNIGRETLVLEKQSDGSWKIRHSHTSGRARPQP